MQFGFNSASYVLASRYANESIPFWMTPMTPAWFSFDSEKLIKALVLSTPPVFISPSQYA